VTGPPQTHHGITVFDLDDMEQRLRSVGFTDYQPNAEEPLWFYDRADDPVGQMTACVLGAGYRTHYIENPATSHQICLIEVLPQPRLAHPGGGRLETDLTITVPVADPERATALLGDREVQDFRFVPIDEEPWALVYYSHSGWAAARRFYEDVLGVGIDEIGTDRYQFVGVGGRLEVQVDPAIPPLAAGLGKRYQGANHFRLLRVELADAAARIDADPSCSFLLRPANGFAFAYGPCGEAVELFDRSVTDPALPHKEDAHV